MIAAMAEAVRQGQRRATDIARETIANVGARNPGINAVTRLLAERALATAAAVDAMVAKGTDPGPLAGVVFGVKDLFDLAGLPTTAGAAMLRDAPSAAADAEAVTRLIAAGAVPVATLNMDEFAYGFATINAHWGTTRNPRDPARLAGGSSGGSAAAVAAGMLPFALGSDTNGSIRVPASLTGTWGLKPTHGTLPMSGVFPFVDLFDDIGPLAGSLDDLALVTRVLGRTVDGGDGAVPAAMLGGFFARNLAPEMITALAALAAALDAPTVELDDVQRARSAAFLITARGGGRRHLPELQARPMAFDPQVRDRLIAGATLSEDDIAPAMAFRATFLETALALFDRYPVLIAPSTFGPAPLIASPFVMVDGEQTPARNNLGLYAQPLSFIGLPVIAAPLAVPGLPLGVQLIGRPGSEPMLFAFARTLVERGLTA